MNKSEMVTEFKDKFGISRAKADELVNGVFDLMVAALKKDGELSIPKFGRFNLVYVPAKESPNNFSGDGVYHIPAHYRVKYNPYQTLKDAVNE